MKLIVGLGNPGPEYAGTRHNIGFDALDRFAASQRGFRFEEKGRGAYAAGRLFGTEVRLLKPLTYMNRSGEAVEEALDSLDPEPDPETDLLVVCDGVHLPLGRMRFRAGGSPGGHNGLASVEMFLATDRYPRLRLGVGPAPAGDLVDFVLGRFPEAERPVAAAVADRAAAALRDWLAGGTGACQNRYNGLDLLPPEAGELARREDEEEDGNGPETPA
jgi:peptidyl-tRNA hydrolase, PTH1 family